MTGIYKITNNVNGKSYIGQSKNITKRWAKHRKPSSWKDNPSMLLYKAFMKYGFDNFSFEVIEKVHTDNLLEREVYWKQHYNTFADVNLGYNSIRGIETNQIISGEDVHTAILDRDKVSEIVTILSNTLAPIKEIAKLFDVSKGAIYDINSGKNWFNQELDYPVRKLNPKNLKD